jgi:NADH-quinone oxidoreductase subunit G
MSETPLLNVQIDGAWIQVPKGTRMIEACERAGKFIPRYCYHPKLSSPGNCRMCLVEMGLPRIGPDRKPELGPDGMPAINWMPRPQISCASEVSDGMGIRTDSAMVKECRNSVMEFLLINHPLDCPICDQAGECRLQEFSVEYGHPTSRFLDRKVKKPKNVTLGPRVLLDAERCILCTRCIRFMKEVANDDVLGIVNRGSHSTIAIYPGRELDSNYSLNTVDLCPVGALTSSDFRFKMRVWFLKETKSICTGCATGCNTLIGSRQNTIHRQTPRQNDAVNSCWMCDSGRLGFHAVGGADRLKAPSVERQPADWRDAIARAAAALGKCRGDEVAIVASARMTNEELFLTARLAAALGTDKIDVVRREGAADGILVSADRNPNSRGAALFGVATGKLAAVAASKPRAVIALGEDAAEAGFDLAACDFVLAVAALPDTTGKVASVLLPGAAYAEKRGTMINGAGRLQRLNKAVEPPGQARDDWEILADLLRALGAAEVPATYGDLFAAMAASVPPLAGLTFDKVGDGGVQLEMEAGLK